MGRDLVRAQGPSIQGDFIKFSFEPEHPVIASSKENPRRTRRHRVNIFATDLGNDSPIQMHPHRRAVTNQHHMMPLFGRQHRATSQNLVSLVAIKEKQAARRFRQMGASNTKMLTPRHGIAVHPARKTIASDRALAGRQTIPHPEFRRVHIAQRHLRRDSPTGTMYRPIDLGPGKMGSHQRRSRTMPAPAASPR